VGFIGNSWTLWGHVRKSKVVGTVDVACLLAIVTKIVRAAKGRFVILPEDTIELPLKTGLQKNSKSASSRNRGQPIAQWGFLLVQSDEKVESELGVPVEDHMERDELEMRKSRTGNSGCLRCK